MLVHIRHTAHDRDWEEREREGGREERGRREGDRERRREEDGKWRDGYLEREKKRKYM